MPVVIKQHLQSRRQVKIEIESALRGTTIHPDEIPKLCDKITNLLFTSPAQPKMFAAEESAAEKKFKRIIEIYGSAKLWVVDEEREVVWFHREIEENKAYASVDVEGAVARWEAFLEAEFDQLRLRKPNRFPVKRFKVSLLNWLAHEKMYSSTGSNGSQALRTQAKKNSLGRKETPREFEERVRRICERKGVPYEGPMG